jgi:hypothetical protein
MSEPPKLRAVLLAGGAIAVLLVTVLAFHSFYQCSGPQPTLHGMEREENTFFERKLAEWKEFDAPAGSEGHKTDLLPILMGKADLRLFMFFVRFAPFYFEWGSGGSTQLTPYLTGHAGSVDMHPEWCQKMEEENAWAANAVQLGLLKYHCVKHGKPLKEWGRPKEQKDWRYIGERYVRAIDAVSKRMPVSFPGYYDVIFVDGRYRVGCALYAVLKGYALPKKTFLMIDDYGMRLSLYGKVEKYLKRVSGGTGVKKQTALFVVKESFDKAALQEDVKKYIGIPH